MFTCLIHVNYCLSNLSYECTFFVINQCMVIVIIKTVSKCDYYPKQTKLPYRTYFTYCSLKTLNIKVLVSTGIGTNYWICPALSLVETARIQFLIHRSFRKGFCIFMLCILISIPETYPTCIDLILIFWHN